MLSLLLCFGLGRCHFRLLIGQCGFNQIVYFVAEVCHRFIGVIFVFVNRMDDNLDFTGNERKLRLGQTFAGSN